jgi:hypothetical protein
MYIIRFQRFYLISFEVLGPLHRAEALCGLQERLEEAILEFDRVLDPLLKNFFVRNLRILLS